MQAVNAQQLYHADLNAKMSHITELAAKSENFKQESAQKTAALGAEIDAHCKAISNLGTHVVYAQYGPVPGDLCEGGLKCARNLMQMTMQDSRVLT